MSQHDLKMFFEAVAREESLRAKFQAIGARYPDQDLDESHREAVFENELLPLARSAGFEFTLEDIKAFQAQSLKADKLADDELDAVVGGNNPYQCYCIAGGGGAADDPGEGTCVCVVYGVGSDENGHKRCDCFFGGMGLD